MVIKDRDNLRMRAEARLGVVNDDISIMSGEEIRKIINELRTCQIELEMQNEELREAQSESEESRRNFIEFYDYTPTAYLTINDDGQIIKANLTASHLLGEARKFLLNQPLTTFIFTEDHDTLYLSRKKLLKTKMKQSCNLRIQKKGGNLLSAQLEIFVIPKIDGEQGQFRAIITDITERKRTEELIINAKKEWEKTFDAMSDIVTIQDKDMRIIRANKAAYDVFQVEPGALNGRYCYEVFREASSPCLNCPELLTLKEGKIHGAHITHKNLGKIFHVTSAPVFDTGGLSHIVHIAKDITEQKKIEDELFQAHKMEAIGTLAGGIAHDFNNILVAILGYAEMAQGAVPAGSPLKNHIDQVLKAGNRAKELVRQILTFSRKGPETRLPLQPSSIIKEGLKLMRATLPSTIEIRQEIDVGCGSILANPTNIHQILVNLCTNALHAMAEEKGVLTVKLGRVALQKADLVLEEAGISAGAFVELMVSDTGCGMDEATVERIFEPYFTTKGVGHGTGMGLALVHGIVQGCGGFVRVESLPGKGTTFRVYFPAINEEVVAIEEEQQELLPGGNERILVVDDEEDIIALCQEILEKLGYKVSAYCSSEKTLEVFRLAPDSFDLVITDQTMPYLSGSELAKEIRQIRPAIPIILCTGYSSMISEEKAIEIGVERYMLKPFSKRELAVTVREVLEMDRPSAV